MSAAPTILGAYGGQVETELHRLLDAADFPPPLGDAIAHSVFAGGKRLRPALLMACCAACGGRPEAALPAAAAVEMVHTYSLIHDDLPAMDDDDFRRGKPTCHKVYGQAIAILAGDALQNQAFAVLVGAYEPALASALVGELTAACGGAGMVGGQVMDIRATAEGATRQMLEDMHARKTGALIAAAARCGARIGGAEAAKIDALGEYGRHLGLAFQITDDILDATASSAQLGKTAGKDAAAGKLTFPALVGLEASRKAADAETAAALAALAALGPAAEPLAELARFVRDRTH
jgi:geranylgeranyl diphosphate synthase type II